MIFQLLYISNLFFVTPPKLMEEAGTGRATLNSSSICSTLSSPRYELDRGRIFLRDHVLV